MNIKNTEIDGYCLDIIDQYLYRLLFPWIAFITIRSDSEFWRLLLLSWQTSSTLVGEDDGKSGDDNIWDKLKYIFGSGHREGKRSFLNPLIDALSMGVKMVDFTELQETSDPIAMGSTATVSKAKLLGETVAIKVFIFDELSIEVVSEFFRESLLISDLHHENIVEFKGACLRPPELCLVYEYCCCGDLTHLLLTQYFHSNFMHNQDDEEEEPRPDPKIFKHRLKMLIDVSRGMTRLHDSGIIHRDLKTSNVLVHFKYGKYIAKVCDFGSARKIISPNGGVNSFGDDIASNQRSFGKSTMESNGVYNPPKRMEHARSMIDDEEEKKKLSDKHIARSINNYKNKKQKKHEIVIENKGINNPHHKPSNSAQINGIIDDGPPNKLEKKKSKHQRSQTINISKGIFGRKLNRLKNRNKPSKAARVESNTNHEFGDGIPEDDAPDMPSQTQNNNGNQSQSRHYSLNHLQNEMEYKDDDDYGYIKGKHKTSVNFDDVEEEEKYHQPTHVTAGASDKHLSIDRAKKKSSYGSFADVDDDAKTIMTEVTDAADINFGADAINHRRDPTKLAFEVNPIMMTTQVGTLAFMAPEILSHVNIGALSGGWANKDDDKDKGQKSQEKKNKVDIIEEDRDMEYEEEEQKYPQQKHMQRQHQLSKSVPKGHNMNVDKAAKLPFPPERRKKYPAGSPNMIHSGSGNHLAIAQQHKRHHQSTESKASEWTTTESNDDNQSVISSAKSETIVIRINTKNDPHYQQNNNGNNGNGKYLNPQLNMVHEDVSTMPSTYNTNPKSMNSAPTINNGGNGRDFPIIRSNPHSNSAQKGGSGNNMMEMEQYGNDNDNNGVWNQQSPTNAQKRFSREYIRKHRQLSQGKARITPPPKKALPPAPPPGIGLFGRGRNGSASITSTVSQSFRKMFTSNSNNMSSWENRDIYFYNQRNNGYGNNYGNAYSQYTNKPSPNMYNNYLSPSPHQTQTYQVGLKSPNNNYQQNLPNSYHGTSNNNYLLPNGNNMHQQTNIYAANKDYNNNNHNAYNTAPKQNQNQIPNGHKPVPPIGNNNNNGQRMSINNKYMPSKPIPQPPMASIADLRSNPNHEINDPRFSTTSTINRNRYNIKNSQKYMAKQLPPDPPKKKKKKAQYHVRGRTQSKYSARSRRGSNITSNILSNMRSSNNSKSIRSIRGGGDDGNISINGRNKDIMMDDTRSMVYETQKFEIIYEVSDTAFYDDSVDVYSFGVIMWECGLCDRIYNQMDMKMIRDMVCEGKRMPTPDYKKCKKDDKNGLNKISKSVYNAFIELVNDCWAQSPIDRPKFYEVEHRLELIQNLHEMKTEQKMNKSKNKNGKKYVE